MLSSQNLPQGQNWIVQPMQSIGMRSNQTGVCYGITYMAMHAILLRDMDSFIARLYKINALKATYPQKLTRLNHIREKINAKAKLQVLQQQKVSFDPSTAVSSSLDELISDVTERSNIRAIIRKRVNNLAKKYAIEEAELIDIMIFLQGIEFYFQPHFYKEYFKKNNAPSSQNGKECTPLLIPITLKNQGGVANVDHFGSAYTYTELQHYFSSLRHKLEQHAFQHPVALMLSSGNHAITVGYDPKLNQWIFVNPDNLPPKFIGSDTELSKLVMNAYSKNMVAVFSTDIYIAKNHMNDLIKPISEWKSTSEWQAMHALSPEKIALRDSHGVGLLYLAARNGDIHLLTSLLSQTDVNQTTNHGVTPLYIAAQNNHIEAVKLLLDANAMVNKPINTGATPLYIAAQNNHIDIVRLLLAKNATVNITNGDVTPLLIACQKGNDEVVRELLAHNASPNDSFSASVSVLIKFAEANQRKNALQNFLATKKIKPAGAIPGFSALHLAVFFGHIETVKVLLAADANVSHKAMGITAFELATIMNHVEIAEILKEKLEQITQEELKLTPNKAAFFQTKNDTVQASDVSTLVVTRETKSFVN